MDDWTYPYPDDLDSRWSQPILLDQAAWGAVEAPAQAEAARRTAELAQTRRWEGYDYGRNVKDVPLPFATPSSAALAF